MQEADGRLTTFAVYDPGAVDNNGTRPFECPSFFKRNSKLGAISLSLLGIPFEWHYYL